MDTTMIFSRQVARLGWLQQQVEAVGQQAIMVQPKAKALAMAG
jgi:hypothetical protein